MASKYIVVEVKSGMLAHDVAICFPDCVVHADMARAMQVTPEQVVSAGFFSVSTSSPHGEICVDVYGESVSLKKHARMVDSKLIAKSIGVA